MFTVSKGVRLNPKRLGVGVKIPVYISPGVKKVLQRKQIGTTGFVTVSKSQANFFKSVNVRYNTSGYPFVTSKRIPKGLGKTTAGVHEIAEFIGTGKKAPKGFNVDHINSNHSDARVGNLQIISQRDNIAKIPKAHRQLGFRKRNAEIKQRTGLTLSQYRAKTIGFAGLSKIAKNIARNLGKAGLSAKAIKAVNTKGASGLSRASKKGAKTLGKAGIRARNRKISAALKGHKAFNLK